MFEWAMNKLGYYKLNSITTCSVSEEENVKLRDQMMMNLSGYEEAINQEKYGSLMREIHMMEKHRTDLMDILTRARSERRIVEYGQGMLQRVTSRILDAQNAAESWGQK